MITGTNISLILNNKTVLNTINFTIPKEQISVFIGPSGAGKTSLLKCIANLYTHYQGSLFLDNTPIKTMTNKERAHHIGFIFQQFNLFKHMTVLENCSYPCAQLLGISAEQAKTKALNILKSFGLQSYTDSLPAKLSGGQQQRVAIARALCLEPKVLLLDEPSSALDPQATDSLAKLLKKLCQNGMSIAISSHDMSFVKAVADVIYYLEEGSIQEQCPYPTRTIKNKIDRFLNN